MVQSRPPPPLHPPDVKLSEQILPVAVRVPGRAGGSSARRVEKVLIFLFDSVLQLSELRQGLLEVDGGHHRAAVHVVLQTQGVV